MSTRRYGRWLQAIAVVIIATVVGAATSNFLANEDLLPAGGLVGALVAIVSTLIYGPLRGFFVCLTALLWTLGFGLPAEAFLHLGFYAGFIGLMIGLVLGLISGLVPGCSGAFFGISIGFMLGAIIAGLITEPSMFIDLGSYTNVSILELLLSLAIEAIGVVIGALTGATIGLIVGFAISRMERRVETRALVQT